MTVSDKEVVFHPISWSSTTVKRVCRSTVMAETFAMTLGTEAGARARAAVVVDMKGELDKRQWENGSRSHPMGWALLG